MKLKRIKIFLLLLFVAVICVSCSTGSRCMKYHNDDVKRGLAH